MQRQPFRPALTAVFLVLGLMLAAVFNTNIRIREARPERASELADVVRSMERQRSHLRQWLADLRVSTSQLERRAASESGMSESFSRELYQARALAGLTPVRGPGLEVVLADAEHIPSGKDPNDYIIHDFDVSAVLNALLASGAEAVSISGERVVVTTSVRCAGNTILVNGTRLGNPYTIRAIGDPQRLLDGLDSDESSSLVFKTYRDQYRLRVSTRKTRSLTVPAYKGSLTPHQAVPSKGGQV